MTTTHNTPSAQNAAISRPLLHVSVLLPCRNEEQTVGVCVEKALTWLERRGLEGEVLVVDNASTDGSAHAATAAGARVIREPRVGYGTAIRTGMREARGAVIIMADADNTYDLTDLDEFYDPIGNAHTHDMVIGDRLARPLEPGAMTRLHRLGNRALSALTRRATRTSVRDVHCGLRAFSATALADLPTWSTGMEFATHSITHAHKKGLRITQCATALAPASPGRRSHLRPARDGIRHLTAIARATSETLRLRAG